MERFLFLFVRDLRVFYFLTKKLKAQGFEFSVFDEKYIPKRASVIVTDEEGKEEIENLPKFQKRSHHYEFIKYENYPNYATLIIQIIKKIRDIGQFYKLTCAIDPGQKNIGLAYFLDERLLNTELFHHSIDVIQNINLYTLSLKPTRFEIKIGRGNLKSMRDIVRLLLGSNEEYVLEQEDFEIMLVDERGSSQRHKPKNYYELSTRYSLIRENISRDEKAAIRIGLRPGERLDYDTLEQILNCQITSSDLKNIQRLSRRKTKGKYSLSRKLAKKVFLGQLSMDKALNIQIRQKKE